MRDYESLCTNELPIKIILYYKEFYVINVSLLILFVFILYVFTTLYDITFPHISYSFWSTCSSHTALPTLFTVDYDSSIRHTESYF